MKSKLFVIFILFSFAAQANTNKSLQSILSDFEVYKSPYTTQSSFYLTDRNFEQIQTELLNKLGSSWSVDSANQNSAIPSLTLSNNKNPKQKFWIGYKGEVTPQRKNMFSISILPTK